MTPKRFLYLFFGIPQFKELFAAIAAKDRKAVKEWFRDNENAGILSVWVSCASILLSIAALIS